MSTAPQKLILQNKQSPGDLVMLTAALRDLHKAHPGRFLERTQKMKPLDGPIQPGGEEREAQLRAADESARGAVAMFRKMIDDGLSQFPERMEWMRAFQPRLAAIEAGIDARDAHKVAELLEEFQLEFNAGFGEVLAKLNASMVSNLDWIAARAEERKFEMSAEARDGIEDLMMPYHDTMREKMLGEMPIEERRKLEENARRLREEGTTDGNGRTD